MKLNFDALFMGRNSKVLFLRSLIQVLIGIVTFFNLTPALSQISTTNKIQVTQLSGFVKDELGVGVPYVSVINRSRTHGAVSASNGYYTLSVLEGDTIDYEALGYKEYYHVLPYNIEGNKLLLDVHLKSDTFHTEITYLYLYPTFLHFKTDFLGMNLPDSILDNVAYNLSQEILNIKSDAYYTDASEQQLQMANLHLQKMYYLGGGYNFHKIGNTPIPNALTDPLAWNRFIKAVKKGMFKKKK